MPKVECNILDLTVIEDFLPLELGGVDVILGMQWLRTMGYMGVDWSGLTMTFEKGGEKVTLKGDASLTKAEVSLKMLQKTWKDSDQGYLIELRGLNVETNSLMTKEVFSEAWCDIPDDIQPLISEYPDVFEMLEGLPPKRKVDHCINLKEGQGVVNVRPYKYAHAQKNEMEKLILEMLTSGIIRPSTSPYSSPVLLVKKKKTEDGDSA